MEILKFLGTYSVRTNHMLQKIVYKFKAKRGKWEIIRRRFRKACLEKRGTCKILSVEEILINTQLF